MTARRLKEEDRIKYTGKGFTMERVVGSPNYKDWVQVRARLRGYVLPGYVLVKKNPFITIDAQQVTAIASTNDPGLVDIDGKGHQLFLVRVGVALFTLALLPAEVVMLRNAISGGFQPTNDIEPSPPAAA